MNRFFASLAAVVSLVSLVPGCGAAPAAPAPAPLVVPLAVADAGAKSSAPADANALNGPRRSASDALKKGWAFEAPMVVAYADFRGLMRTTLMSALGQSLVAMMATTEASAASRKCLGDALTTIEELALGTDGRETLIVARLEPATTKWIGPCVLELFPTAKTASFPGATEAWVNKTDVLAVSPGGLFFLGPRLLVERGLTGRSSGASLDTVALGEGEYLAWNAHVFPGEPAARGTLVATEERFRIEGEATLPKERAAQEIETELAPDALAASLPKAVLTSDDARRLGRLVQAISVKRDGRHVALSFDLREAAPEQARDLGAAAALAIYGVRKYIAAAKATEARNVVGHLAKTMVADWESEPADGKPRGKRKLVSFAPVPKTVPKGVKYQSSPADWKPWAPLRFSMDLPQYYQYEIKAAKDGQSAEIIARGDLNGDGKTSQFKLRLSVEHGSDRLTVSPSIEEIDPEE